MESATTIGMIILNLLFIFAISLSCGVLVKHLTKLKLLFYSPIGYLAFLGVTYFLAFPFIIFKWYASIYYWILFFLAISIMIFAVFLTIINKKKIEFSKEKIAWASIGLLLIVIGILITSRYIFGKIGFDSTFYLTGVVNNVTYPFLGHFNNHVNTGMATYTVEYSFSSYYYFQSFIIYIHKSFFPFVSNTVMTPMYIWQSTIAFLGITVFTFINVAKMIRNKLSILAAGIIVVLFFGTLYYNTALAFLGNPHRIQIVANLFLLAYLIFSRKKIVIPQLILLTLVLASLISVSRSGFFIGAFFVYGLFYALVCRKVGFIIFKYMLISIPILLYAFTYIGWNPFIPTVLVAILFYFLSTIKLNIELEQTVFKISRFIMLAIPAVIVVFVVFQSSSFEFGMDYFFFHNAIHDMGWDYFYLSKDLFANLANVVFLVILVVSIAVRRKSGLVHSIIFIIVLTFLNPFVIPFTIKYFTSFVFNRSFDLLFNSFIIIYGLGILYQLINHKQIQIVLTCIIAVVFSLLGFNNLTTYYVVHFLPEDAENFNSVYRLEQSKMDAIYALEQHLKENDIDNKVISQLYETRAYIPELQVIDSIPFLRNTDNRKTMTENEVKLMNLFWNREYVDKEYIDDEVPDFTRMCPLLEEENIDIVLVKQESFFLNSEGTYISLVQTLRNCGWTAVYENETYIVMKSDR